MLHEFFSRCALIVLKNHIRSVLAYAEKWGWRFGVEKTNSELVCALVVQIA